VFLRHVLGSGAASIAVPGRTGGVLNAPVRGFVNTWLSPTHEGNFRIGLALILALGFIAASALLARRQRPPVAVVACLGAATVAYAVWVVHGPPVPISG